MIFRKAFPLLTALWLQLAPFLARWEAATTHIASPIVSIVRWMVGGAVVAGSFHAVFGATDSTTFTVTGISGGKVQIFTSGPPTIPVIEIPVGTRYTLFLRLNRQWQIWRPRKRYRTSLKICRRDLTRTECPR